MQLQLHNALVIL